MGYEVKRGSTSRPLNFLMVDSSDHLTGKEGLTPTVSISKNGQPFEAPQASVIEIGKGRYYLEANASDNDTLGILALHAEADGADDVDLDFEVVNYDPDLGSSVQGTGSVEHTIFVKTTGLVVISDVQVYITTDINGNNIVAGSSPTDSFGQVTFLLDPGTYFCWRQKTGYNFTNPQQFSVA